MKQAAVGFQCPSCVKDGARSTRSGRTPYGGVRPGTPGLVSMVLIGINVAVFVLIAASGGQSGRVFNALALLPESHRWLFPDQSVRTVTGVADGAWWQLLTSAFTHVELMHIGFNMLALYFLGPQLEMVLGRLRFLALYLVSGLVGSACVLWLSAPGSQTIGASGAIFGLMGALLVVALKMRGNVTQIALWIGLNAVFTVLGASFISWQGHLGGFVGGTVIALIYVYAPKSARAPVQWAGLGVLLGLTAVAAVVRALQLG